MHLNWFFFRQAYVKFIACLNIIRCHSQVSHPKSLCLGGRKFWKQPSWSIFGLRNAFKTSNVWELIGYNSFGQFTRVRNLVNDMMSEAGLCDLLVFVQEIFFVCVLV